MDHTITADTLSKLRKGGEEIVVIEGYHAFKHALRFGAEFTDIVFNQRFKEANFSQTVRDNEAISTIVGSGRCLTSEEFQKLITYDIPTGIIALAKKPPVITNSTDIAESDQGGGQSVYLENVQNVSNLGAVIRVCAAYGIKSLYVSGKIQPWHAGVIRTSAGLSWALQIISIPSTEDILEYFSDKVVVACTDEGESVYSVEIPENSVLCFGTERDGLTRELRDEATMKVGLPMQPGVSSLNLATSVSAVLYAQGAKS